jgi:hypothetical protein
MSPLGRIEQPTPAVKQTFINNSNHNGNKYENCQFIFNAAPTQENAAPFQLRDGLRIKPNDWDQPSPKNNSSIREIHAGSFGAARESLKKSPNGSAASLDSMISPGK